MKKIEFLISLVISLSLSMQEAKASPFHQSGDEKLTLYAWEFKLVNEQNKELIKYRAGLTREFEEALIACNCFTVLQRQVYGALFAQIENEKQIAAVHELPDSVLQKLKHITAEAVVFGEMSINDTDGYVTVGASIENFDSRILGKESIHFPKYVLHNPVDLESKVEELLQKILKNTECNKEVDQPVENNISVERECENPDRASTGKSIDRSEASRLLVHGNFGCKSDKDFDAITGEVEYQGIFLEKAKRLFLKIRYSKNTDPSVPIKILLNDKLVGSFIPENTNSSWNSFVWSEAIALGAIDEGNYTIKFQTQGQQWGVADLDKFSLSNKKN